MVMTQGEKLKLAIRGKGLSMEEAATALQITRQTLHNYIKSAKLDKEFLQNVKKKLRIDLEQELQLTPDEGTPIYELSATASQMDNIGQLPEVPTFHVKIPGYEDCNFGMYVFGHSMYPTIETGSLVLCRKIHDKTVIMYGEIYLIRTKDYLMVKRLQKNEQKGYVLCTSVVSQFEYFSVS